MGGGTLEVIYILDMSKNSNNTDASVFFVSEGSDLNFATFDSKIFPIEPKQYIIMHSVISLFQFESG